MSSPVVVIHADPEDCAHLTEVDSRENATVTGQDTEKADRSNAQPSDIAIVVGPKSTPTSAAGVSAATEDDEGKQEKVASTAVSEASKDPEEFGKAEEAAGEDVPAIRLRNFNLYVRNAMHTPDKNAPVQHNVKGIGTEDGATLHILKHVNVSFPKNQLTALMGPSGCGKSTLLAYLGGRRQAAGTQVFGEVYYCGHDMSAANPQKITIADLAGDATSLWHSRLSSSDPTHQEFFNERLPRVGFVLQNDMLTPTMTVYETLLFAAHMTLVRKHPNPADREAIVEDVIAALGLTECRDTLIGGPELAGCSGGERRRVSVGVQLLTQPDILLLDEPTTGLDSTSAASLVRLLRSLSRGEVNIGGGLKSKLKWKPMTIIAAIHQPRQDVFEQFDHVSLMSRGVIVYDGPREAMGPYFHRIHYPTPARMNPADHYIDVCSIDVRSPEAEVVSTKRLNYLAVEWFVSPEGRRLRNPEPVERLAAARLRVKKPHGEVSTHKSEEVVTSVSVASEAPPFFYQLKWLLWRWVRIMYRDKDALWGNFVQAVTTSILLGIIFLNQGHNEQGIRGRTSVCFSLSILYAYTVLLIQLTLQVQQIKIYKQEAEANFYRAPAFMLSREMLQWPLYFVLSMIYSLTLHGMAGLNSSEPWYRWAVAIFTYGSTLSMCALSSLSVAISADYEIATMFANFYYLFGAFSAGFFVAYDSIPLVVRWVRYIEPFYYSFISMAHLEFHGVAFDCPNPGSPECALYTGDYTLQQIGVPLEGHYVKNMLISLGITLAMYAVALVILMIKEYLAATFPSVIPTMIGGEMTPKRLKLIEAIATMRVEDESELQEGSKGIKLQVRNDSVVQFQTFDRDQFIETAEKLLDKIKRRTTVHPNVQAALELSILLARSHSSKDGPWVPIPKGLVSLRAMNIKLHRTYHDIVGGHSAAEHKENGPSHFANADPFKWISFSQIERWLSREPVVVTLKDLSLGVLTPAASTEAAQSLDQESPSYPELPEDSSPRALVSNKDADYDDEKEAGGNNIVKLPPSTAEKAAARARKENAQLKWLFQTLNVEFKPRELWAIMGGSGSGKTSLLSFISQRLDIDTKSMPPLSQLEAAQDDAVEKMSMSSGYKYFGGLYFNGEPTSLKLARRYVGLVTQHDTLLPALTVRETLMFAAHLRLRLPQAALNRLAKARSNPDLGNPPTAEELREAWISARVDNLIRELGLLECQNTLIGGETVSQKGLSGGQKRRVTIALQMLTDPSVLLLDEPTSGLDSFMAYNVSQTLKHIAVDKGRTVIATIHQPRVDVFSTFTHCVIMSKSNVVYVGPTKLLWNYFTTVPKRHLQSFVTTPVEIPDCPETHSVSDWVLDICTVDTTTRESEDDDGTFRSMSTHEAIAQSVHKDKIRIKAFARIWQAYEAVRKHPEARKAFWAQGEAYYGEEAQQLVASRSLMVEHDASEELYETVCERCGTEYTILQLRSICNPQNTHVPSGEEQVDCQSSEYPLPQGLHKFVCRPYPPSPEVGPDNTGVTASLVPPLDTPLMEAKHASAHDTRPSELTLSLAQAGGVGTSEPNAMVVHSEAPKSLSTKNLVLGASYTTTATTTSTTTSTTPTAIVTTVTTTTVITTTTPIISGDITVYNDQDESEVQDLQEADVWPAYKVLMSRSMVNLQRQPIILTTRLSHGIFYGLFTILFFTPLSKSQIGMRDRIGVLTSLQSYGYVAVMNCLAMFPQERDLFHRERSDGLYGVAPFMLGYFTIEFTVTVVSVFLTTVMYAFPVQLSLISYAENYCAFVFALLCLSSFAESLSIVCLVLCHHPSFAMAVITIVYNVLEPMSSLYSPEANMWAPIRGLARINPLRYYAHIAASVEFKDTTFYCKSDELVGGVCPFTNGRDYIATLGYDPSELGENIGILFCLVVIYRFLAVLCLKYQWRRIRAATVE